MVVLNFQTKDGVFRMESIREAIQYFVPYNDGQCWMYSFNSQCPFYANITESYGLAFSISRLRSVSVKLHNVFCMVVEVKTSQMPGLTEVKISTSSGDVWLVTKAETTADFFRGWTSVEDGVMVYPMGVYKAAFLETVGVYIVSMSNSDTWTGFNFC